LSCRGPLPCCQPRICSSTFTCWLMTRSAPVPSPLPPGRARRRAAATPSCWPSRWCGICRGAAARPGSWPRWRGTGRTYSPSCRITARRTGGSADCGARSSNCWRRAALPVKHTSRVRGADQWTGPGNDLAARFGRCHRSSGGTLPAMAAKRGRAPASRRAAIRTSAGVRTLTTTAWARAALDHHRGRAPRKPSHEMAATRARHWRATASERRQCCLSR
jgi:hypothetical protein